MSINGDYVTIRMGKVNNYEENIKSFHACIDCFFINGLYENEN